MSKNGKANPFPGLRVRWMLVGVNLAAEWLKHNTRNRPMLARYWEKYARDMLADRWGFCEAMIIFADDGSLMNGQHRLEGIVHSGKPQWFVVATGIPKGMIFNMDQGGGRSFRHNWNLAHEDNIQNRTAAAAMFVWSTPFATSKAFATHHDKARIVDKHREALAWVDEKLGTSGIRGITVAPVAGVILRAYYSANRERLGEFVRVLVTGESNGPKDSAGVKLRNWLIARAAKTIAKGNRGLTDALYKKTEFALAAFLKGERVTTLRDASKELFEVA